MRAQLVEQINGVMAVIPHRARTRSDRRPDVFQRSFLSDAASSWNQISMTFAEARWYDSGGVEPGHDNEGVSDDAAILQLPDFLGRNAAQRAEQCLGMFAQERRTLNGDRRVGKFDRR